MPPPTNTTTPPPPPLQVLERILKIGLLPDDVRFENTQDELALEATLLRDAGLSSEVLKALRQALGQYDKVQSALQDFDSLSMGEECSFTMNLGLPMGLRLDDDTLVVLAVEPQGQAAAHKVPVGARVLAVGGETVTIVEDAIAALKRMRDAGNLECTVVYKEFKGDAKQNPVLNNQDKPQPQSPLPQPGGLSAANGGGQEARPPAPPLPSAADAAAAAALRSSGRPASGEAPGEGGDAVEGSPTKRPPPPPLPPPPGYPKTPAPATENDAAATNGLTPWATNNGGALPFASPEPTGAGLFSPVPGVPSPGAALEGEEKPVSGRRKASWAATQAILAKKRNTTSTSLISAGEFEALLQCVAELEENQAKVDAIKASSNERDPDPARAGNEAKLFTCGQILKLCETTPSIKTRHAMLEFLVPRCTNPAEQGHCLVDLFRFTEDKAAVSEALKIRASALKAGMQLVASTGGAFVGKDGSGSSGAAAAAVAIAGVTYGVGGGVGKKKGSLGAGIGGTNPLAVHRDANGMISNPLLRIKEHSSHGI